MAETLKRPNEPFDKVMRRFKKKVKEEGILLELKKKEFYEKPSEVKARVKKAAERKNRSRQDEDNW